MKVTLSLMLRLSIEEVEHTLWDLVPSVQELTGFYAPPNPCIKIFSEMHDKSEDRLSTIRKALLAGRYDLQARAICLYAKNWAEHTTPEHLRPVLAHEYLHHLQNYHFPHVSEILSTTSEKELHAKERRALKCLLEGHAVHIGNHFGGMELRKKAMPARTIIARSQLQCYYSHLQAEMSFPYRHGSAVIEAIAVCEGELSIAQLYDLSPRELVRRFNL
jgi:hypothetical protein